MSKGSRSKRNHRGAASATAGSTQGHSGGRAGGGARGGGSSGGRQGGGSIRGGSSGSGRGSGSIQGGSRGGARGGGGGDGSRPRRRAARGGSASAGLGGFSPRTWSIAGAAVLVVLVIVLVVALGSKSKPTEANVSFAGTGYPNGNLANTRASESPIDQANVSKLQVAWKLPLSEPSQYGSYAATPVIAGGVVYSQDLQSNVKAISLQTGNVLWSKEYNVPAYGPNGVVVANGEVFGETETSAFALQEKTGKQLWSVQLTENEEEGIDVAPGYYKGIVYFSTVPGNVHNVYKPPADGTLYALDAKTGRKLWRFDTSQKLWGNPSVNSGGGVWYTPAFDSEGGMYFGTGNPEPSPGTEEFPWGTSRPGPDLYNDSLVKLDATTGKLKWYYQVTPHDLYDWDQQDPPILAEVKGRQVVLTAGKSGVVAAVDRRSGRLLWRRDVGVHNGHDQDGLYAMRHEYSKLKLPETVYPGELGGVIAPMASNGKTVFAPVVNMPVTFSSQSGQPNEGPSVSGEMVALDIATGKVRWTHKFTSPMFSGATIVNNLVFVPAATGQLYALSANTGAVVWESELPAGTISAPAVEGNTLVIGAGKASPTQKAELVAYRLG